MRQIYAFTASWCKPCNMLKPVLRKLEEEGVKIKYFDADDNVIAKKYRISTIPTLVYMDNDIEYSRTQGLIRKQTILENYNRGVDIDG